MNLKSVVATVLFCAAPVFADSITLPFNTGVNADGSVATAGTVDQNYTSGQSAPFNTVYVEGSPALWAWVAPVNAAWVGPDTQDGSTLNGGQYTLDYSVNFDLTGFDPSTVVLTGEVAADDVLNDILVNGVSSGTSVAQPAFNSLTSFTLDSGFVAGMNTIDFNFTNLGGPGGLLVEFTSASGSPTPEPASFAFLGLGMAGLAFARRKVQQ